MSGWSRVTVRWQQMFRKRCQGGCSMLCTAEQYGSSSQCYRRVMSVRMTCRSALLRKFEFAAVVGKDAMIQLNVTGARRQAWSGWIRQTFYTSWQNIGISTRVLKLWQWIGFSSGYIIKLTYIYLVGEYVIMCNIIPNYLSWHAMSSLYWKCLWHKNNVNKQRKGNLIFNFKFRTNFI